MTNRFLEFSCKEITASALYFVLWIIPLGSAVCVMTGCGEVNAIQDTDARKTESKSDTETAPSENNRRLTYDAIKKYSKQKYGSKSQKTTDKTRAFHVVTDPGESVGDKTSSSPYDLIHSRDNVVQVLPGDAKLVGMGRYYCRQKNWKYYMYQTNSGKKVNWSGQEIPKCMSYSGELCLSNRNALYHTFKTRKNHFFENLKMHDRGQIRRAVFSPTDKLIVGEDYDKLHIVSAETRRPIQTIENAYFPVHLSRDERCLYCLDKDKNLMTFAWSGRRFVPLGKKALTTDDRSNEQIAQYLSFGDGFIVVAKRCRTQGRGLHVTDGLTVYSIDGIKLNKTFEREDWSSSVTHPRTRGTRFAFIRSTGLNKSHWIIYGDAATGKIKQIPFKSKRLDTYSTITELDPSGRYFFVKTDGQVQVIRLESN